jgi:ABC-type branched-subunit amino acid transport system substrate-binding protein
MLTGSAAARSSVTSQVLVPRGQAVQIAFADDLTGSASGFGASLANAVQMAVDARPVVRGFPIHVNLVDAPCGDSSADVAAANSIVANGQNLGVLGQLCSSGFDQPLAVYQTAGLVTISGSATDPSLPSFGPTIFDRTAVNDSCCPFVDQFDPWYAIVQALPTDLAWQQAYSVRFGAPPTAFADLYYDAAGLLIRKLRTVSRIDGDGNLVVDRAALARAVRDTTGYHGVTCRISLDPATGNRVDDPRTLGRCTSNPE